MLLIIITSFNMDRLLSETVLSVYNQTHDTYRVVVVDDGSKIPQRDFLPEEILNDDRFSILRQNNTGVSGARNNGVTYLDMKHDYVMFLDGDDILYENFIEEALKEIQQKNADLFFGKAERFTYQLGDQGSIYGPHKEFIEALPRVLLSRSQLVPSMCLMKNSVYTDLGGFKDSNIYTEDWDFFLRAAGLKKIFIFSDEPLLGYRLNPNSRGERSHRNCLECANTLRANRHAIAGTKLQAMKSESWYLLDAACCLPRTKVTKRLRLMIRAFTAFPYTLRSLKKMVFLVTFQNK